MSIPAERLWKDNLNSVYDKHICVYMDSNVSVSCRSCSCSQRVQVAAPYFHSL